jgi:hypothetical protein
VGQLTKPLDMTVRYERRVDLLTAFLHLACALTCALRLGRVDTA